MTGKQFTSVVESVRDIAPDAAFERDLAARLARRRVVKRLLALRAAKGLSQAQIAEQLGCSQSRISKLENANSDDAVNLGDLRAYAGAVGCELTIGLMPKDIEPAEKVKRHALAIKRHMDHLAKLAKADDRIAQGIGDFFLELLLNFLFLLRDSATRLPRRPDGRPYFDIQMKKVDVDEHDIATECAIETEQQHRTVPA